MSKIKLLKDWNLIGGLCNTPIYPVTTTAAVLCKDEEGNDIANVSNTLEQRLQDIESKLNDTSEQCQCEAIPSDEILKLFDIEDDNTTEEGTSTSSCGCSEIPASEISEIFEESWQ